MKAVIYERVGSSAQLNIKEVSKPIPKDNQVLVNVHASSVCITDYQRFKTKKISFSTKILDIVQGSVGKPLGGEISGIVVATGKNVNFLSVGDEVFGKTTGAFPKGGWAEYAVLDSNQIFTKPKTLSFEESAVLPVACETALGAVKKANIKAGQQVMIYGASGGVGQFAVQFAKAQGAIVTGVCSTRNISMAHSIGCDYVIDYKKEDFRKTKNKFDSIIGINGTNPLKEYLKLLTPNGIFVGVGGNQVFVASVAQIFSKKITTYAAPLMSPTGYLNYVKELAESGKIKPYIDNTYSVYDTSKAIDYITNCHAQGKIAIKMDF